MIFDVLIEAFTLKELLEQKYEENRDYYNEIESV